MNHQQTLDPYMPKMYVKVQFVFDGEVVREKMWDKQVKDIIEYNMLEDIIGDTLI